MVEKMNKNEKSSLLKPHYFNKDDPKNPKNIDAEKALEETKKKRAEELANKKIIIDGKEE